MLTRDEVIWGYRYVLGREPESEDVVARHSAVESVAVFRRALFESREFAFTSYFRPAQPRWVIAPVLGGARMLWINLFDQFVARGCLLDDYEHHESAFVRANLKPASTFLDIGANVGWFTLLASTIITPPGRIVAFEPRRDCAEHLARSIALNGLGGVVTLIPEALSDAPAEGLIAWPKSTPNPGHSFLADTLAEGLEGDAVTLRPLDAHALGAVDFIKLDVEGAEMRVLKGGAATIDAHRPTVLAEVFPEQLAAVSGAKPADLFAFFQERGYRAFIVDERRLGEEIAGYPDDWYRELMNVAFLPRERLESGSAVAPAPAAPPG